MTIALRREGEEVEKRWRWAKVAIFLLFGGKPRWTEEERVPPTPPPTLAHRCVYSRI